MAVKKTKKYVLPILIICMVLLLTVSVLGAYVGRGIKKGVLVASSYYFESDVLGVVSGTENTDVDNISVVCEQGTGSDTVGETIKSVRIQNYKSLAFNSFSVSYNYSIWLSSSDDSDYDVFYSNNNGVSWIQITAAEYSSFTPVSSTLAGGDINFNTISIKWEWTGTGEEDISKAKTVYMVAEPTSPEYLINKKLGATLTVGDHDSVLGYSLQYGFYKPVISYGNEPDYTGSLMNYAGFTYRIAVTGTPPTGEQVRLSWNPDKLILSENIEEDSGIVVELEPVSGNPNITITLEANKTYDIVFYRNTAGTWNSNDEIKTGTPTDHYMIYNDSADSYVKFETVALP